MFFLAWKVVSILLWCAAIPPLIISLAERLPFLRKIDRVKWLMRKASDQLLAANHAGVEKRPEKNKNRPPNPVIDTICGMSTSILLLIAITPWAVANLRIMFGIVFFYLAMLPLSSFLQNLLLLRLGYTRLDNDDDGDGGSEKEPPFEPPPFNGPWAPWPKRMRQEQSTLKGTIQRRKGCGEKSKKPLVVPGPR